MTLERLNIHPPDEHDVNWTIMGDLRLATPNGRDWIEDSTNHKAGEVAAARWDDVEEDSELSCTFVFAPTEERAREVAEWLEGAGRLQYLHAWS